MAISTDQKVDYLWKKLGYGKAKTDIASIKDATNEAISSPLLLRGDKIWAESNSIPASIPGSSSSIVTVYPTSSPVECVVDNTSSNNRTWKTNIVDWIPPELGSTYVVKVYIHTSGNAGSAASSGTQVFAAGSGNNDEWFFDYQSGTLNFIGTNLPNGINFTGKSVYISGAVYSGKKGVVSQGSPGSFTDLLITGISTLGVTSITNLTTQQLYVSGVSTFIGSISGTISTATKLENPRTFDITGDVVASAISFDGTGNVSLAATIQPNSVALGSDTTGDYVQSISGTSNQITVTSGTGEGSTPTLSIPNQFTAPQDVTVTRDLQVDRNLNVNGNITIGGTSAFIAATELKVYDPDIVLGFRSDGFGNDVSNDNTANHGGIAIASTEGTPLVSLYDVGVGETNPATYKKFMWFKSGTFSGLGTDAWLSNYAIGIGSTQVPLGIVLAAGSVQFSNNDLAAVRNINSSGISTLTNLIGTNISYTSGSFNIGNIDVGIVTTLTSTDTTLTNINSSGISTLGVTTVTNLTAISINSSGIITATTFRPSTGYIQAADGTNSFYIYNTNGNVAFQGTIGASKINNASGYLAINFTPTSTPNILIPNSLYVTGITTSFGGFVGNLTGTATTAFYAVQLQTPRTFEITGDIVGSAISFDGTQNVSIAATIQPNSVGLGTDTTGDYVSTIEDSGLTDIVVNNSGTETAAVTLGLTTTGISSGTYGSSTEIPSFTVDSRGRLTAASVTTVSTGMTVAGDSGLETINFLSEILTISGGTNLTSSASSNGVTINLDPDISLTNINASGVVTAINGFVGNLTGDVTGTATTASYAVQLKNSRTFEITGDIVGSAISFDGTQNVSIAATIQPNSVALGTDTTGDYVSTIGDSGLTDIVVNNSGTETAAVTLGLTTTGVIAGSYGSATEIPSFTVDSRGRLTAASVTTVSTGMTVAGDSGLETINFLSEILTISGGTNLNSSASADTVTINLDPDISLTNINASGVVTAINGFVGNLTGTATTATKLENSRTFEITGDIVASAISFDGTGNVSLAATIQPNSVGLGTDTTGDYVATVSDSGLSDIVVNNSGTETAAVTLGLTTTGVIAGSYGSATEIPSFTVDSRGRLTAAGTVFVGTALTVSGDSGLETINFLSEILTISGGTNLTSSASSNGVIIDLDSNISLTNINSSGVVTSTGGFVGNLTGTATTATKLENSRTFEITGDVVASAISFDGTGNVSLAATIQPNSVALGDDTTGNYVATVSDSGLTDIVVNNSGTETAAVTLGLTTTGISSGTYGSATEIPSFTVDSRGRLTAASVTTVSTGMTVAGDSGLETINFLSEILTISGGTNLTSSASSNGVIIDLDSNISLTNINASGVVTSTGGFVGNLTGDVTGTATTASYAVQLKNSRTFEITGDIVASAISFDGTGNVSLAATIQPNSVALGSDTTGDYVSNINGTSNQITVTSGTGEGSTPTLSIPNQFTAPQDVTVTRDLQVDRNLNVNGNITIGGTAATLFTTEFKVSDPDIVLGFRTDVNGNDVSTDNTANHGGIAIASTEGTPLISLYDVGVGETNPATYKKFMWFKEGTFSGLGTDAWLSNYAIGIGSTQVPLGIVLAAGSVQFSNNDLAVVRNINASGIGTIETLDTTTGTIDFLSGTDISYSGIGTIETLNTTTGTIDYLSGTDISYSGIGTINVLDTTTGTIDFLSGTDANISGIGTIVFLNSDNAYIQHLSVSGISTFIDGPVLIGSATSTGALSQPLQVTGGSYISGNLGIGSTNPQFKLDVNGDINFNGTFYQNGNQFIASRWTAGNGDNIYRLSGDVGIGTTNPTSKLTVEGDVYISGIITSTDYNSASDVNLKKDIERIHNPINKILEINGVNFTWKDTNRKSMGVIAQEIEKVLPELVNGGETKTVNYNGLIGLLIECVKEQQKEIELLKKYIHK